MHRIHMAFDAGMRSATQCGTASVLHHLITHPRRKCLVDSSVFTEVGWLGIACALLLLLLLLYVDRWRKRPMRGDWSICLQMLQMPLDDTIRMSRGGGKVRMLNGVGFGFGLGNGV